MREITREMESMEPDGAMFDLLATVDLDGLCTDQLVTLAVLVRKMKSACEWAELAVLKRVDDTTELAMAIREPEQSVARRKEASGALDVLPRLAEQLRRGELDFGRFNAVTERVRHLDRPEQVAEVEDALVDVAAGLNRTQLCRKTTGLVAKADPEGYETRCQKAAKERRVEFSPLPDGMAKLAWTLQATDAHRLFQQICADAKGLPKDDRTTDQKRSDVLMDRVLGKNRDFTVRTYVTVSLETLLGLTNDPGQLAGYGPISADTARELAMHGPWRGILLDEYRHATAISTDTYRPTALMKEFTRAQSGGMCTAPGCNRPIQEHDHIRPWPQGDTTPANLQGLCSRHHHVKHDNYRVTRDSDGTTHWTTPSGRQYSTQPTRH
ncbi:HNH endonuclease [Kutzneria sp. 744]|nr:HNH endonuclease [Kutzneria sp. 744]